MHSKHMLAAVIGLAVLVSAGPTLVALLNAAVPLVVVCGVVFVVVRLVLFHTRRW